MVFYPIALQDALEVVHNSSSDEIEFTSSGLSVEGEPAGNICLKAYHLLKKEFPQLPPVKMHLHKVIPMGAGLGGGSADGAFALLLLNKKLNPGLSEEQLREYALKLGSDCPFFIFNKPCYASGRGEKLEPIELDLSSYRIAVIHTGIHIPTGWAFSQINPSNPARSLKEIIRLPIKEWRTELKNDFEDVVYRQHPEILYIKEELYRQGAEYASMTGSGSAVFGLFDKKADI